MIKTEINSSENLIERGKWQHLAKIWRKLRPAATIDKNEHEETKSHNYDLNSTT